MAVQLLSHEISDLCLGKPPLRQLPVTATISDALSFFRRSSGDTSLSVWSSSSSSSAAAVADATPPTCIGKISVIDVLCFLCKKENITCPNSALNSPLSTLLPQRPPLVKQLDSTSRIFEAVDCILEGAQGIIVPRKSRHTGSPRKKPSQKHSSGRSYCWITQEDVVRFFFNSINHFSPIPFNSLQSLDIIDDKIQSVHYDDPALTALMAISNSVSGQTAVAVVDDEGRLVGEISVYTLACCDEAVAPGVATLSAGDLMAYVDYCGPPEDLVQLVKERLEERKLDGMMELLEVHSNSSVSSCISSSSSSSEDEVALKNTRNRTNSGRFARGTEPIVCHPGSSLIAVMIQALSHRFNHVWVVEDDHSLVGTVTFAGMLKALRDSVPCVL